MLKNKGLLLTAIMLLVLIVTAIGCAAPAVTPAPTAPAPKATTPTATTPAVKPTPTTGPQSGGILKIIFDPATEVATNLGNPTETAQPGDQRLRAPAVETLVFQDPKQKFMVVPMLASSFEYSKDYKTLTFKLRQGVKFHDGTDFNAEAAKYVLEETRKSPSMGPNMAPCSSIDVVDNYTLRLNAKTVFDPSFLINMATYNSAMVSPTALKTRTREQNLYTPIGTGAFKVVNFQRDVSMKFERFDGYWGGKPYLDGIEYIFIADSMTRMAAFKKGDAHILCDLAGKDLADMETAGYNINRSWGGSIGIAFDSKDPKSPFADIKVRQAVAHAIDAPSLCKMLGFNTWVYCNQIYPPASPAFNPAVAGYPYNPAKAKELILQAGYAGGLSTQLTFPDRPGRKDLYTAIQNNLKEIGITVKLNMTDRGSVTGLLTKGWSGLIDGLFMGSQPSGEIAQPVTNTLSRTGGYHVSTFFPEDYDAKVKVAVQELDVAKRVALFQELSKIIIDQYCIVVPIFAQAGGGAYASTVHTDLSLTMSWRPETNWLGK